MESRLYKFARLVEAGSFTKAAAILHISQPALTTAIKKLERELKAELLVRDSHTFKLTAAGGIAYATAREINVQASNLKLRLAEAATQKVQLRLGLIDSIADMLFIHSDNLQMLEQGTHLSLSVDNTTKLLTYVEHDELDIALVSRPSTSASDLTIIDLGMEPLLLVSHTSVAKKTTLGLNQKHLDQFLSYNQNSTTRSLVDQYFTDHAVAVESIFYSTSPEIMLQLVLAGRGCAVLPYLLVKPYLRRGELVAHAIDREPIIGRAIASAHRIGRALPHQATDLLAITRALLAEQLGEAKQV